LKKERKEDQINQSINQINFSLQVELQIISLHNIDQFDLLTLQPRNMIKYMINIQSNISLQVQSLLSIQLRFHFYLEQAL